MNLNKLTKSIIKYLPLITIILIIIVIILIPKKINYSFKYLHESFSNDYDKKHKNDRSNEGSPYNDLSNKEQINKDPFNLYPSNQENIKNNRYLYPIKGLQSICEKDNLKPSFMPKVCFVDGKLNSFANCKCEDSEGNCKICYDTIKKFDNGAGIVYDSQKTK
jgi:hypothetical protein